MDKKNQTDWQIRYGKINDNFIMIYEQNGNNEPTEHLTMSGDWYIVGSKMSLNYFIRHQDTIDMYTFKSGSQAEANSWKTNLNGMGVLTGMFIHMHNI